MKRTPLKRSTPLRRKAWMKQRGDTDTAYRRRTRDTAYMMWVKRQPCCVRDWASTPCYGKVEADHAGRRGVGQKADDRTCIPLCQKHHRERTDFQGTFRLHDQDSMRLFLGVMVEHHQTMYKQSTT